MLPMLFILISLLLTSIIIRNLSALANSLDSSDMMFFSTKSAEGKSHTKIQYLKKKNPIGKITTDKKQDGRHTGCSIKLIFKLDQDLGVAVNVIYMYQVWIPCVICPSKCMLLFLIDLLKKKSKMAATPIVQSEQISNSSPILEC